MFFSHSLGKINNSEFLFHSLSFCGSLISFISLVVESLRDCDEEVVDVIKSISHLLGQRLGTPPAETTQHLLHHLV